LSRLTDLLAKVKAKDSQLGADLEREFKLLSSRLPFGLNFERHSPEAVELALRPVRKGDKVRVLPERGSVKKGDLLEAVQDVDGILELGDVDHAECASLIPYPNLRHPLADGAVMGLESSGIRPCCTRSNW
jgi:adenine-specific DNA-methyltransferase